MTVAKILVTTDEAAKTLSVGKSTLWREAKEGNQLKPIKLGSITKWRVADLQRCVKGKAGIVPEPGKLGPATDALQLASRNPPALAR